MYKPLVVGSGISQIIVIRDQPGLRELLTNHVDAFVLGMVVHDAYVEVYSPAAGEHRGKAAPQQVADVVANDHNGEVGHLSQF
jgi:hypothetical protein